MSDEQLAGAAEIRTELSKVNSGSPREKELSRQLENLYRRQYGEPGAPTPRPDGYEGQSTPTPRPDALAPDEAAIAGTNARALRLDQLRAEREQFGNTTERNRALDLEIEDLLRKDFEAQQSYAEPDVITPASVRPELPAGMTWDEAIVGRFQQEAPGALVLMNVVNEALREAHRSGQRWDDGVATGTALEDRWGLEEAGRLAEDALAYLHEYDKGGKIEANLKAHGVFFNPKLIRDAALFWRRHRADSERS